MNLAIHGLSGEIEYTQGGSLLDDAFPTLEGRLRDGEPAVQPEGVGDAGDRSTTPAGRTATPPTGNANYAWIQHFLFHLAPNGRAGFVMANGSLTTMTSGEGKIRENLVRADVVDCIVALPAAAVLHDRHPGLPLVPRPRQGVERRARPSRRDAVHRRPADGPQDQPHADRADRRGDRADRVAATTPGAARAGVEYADVAWVLPERDARRDRGGRVRALARPLRRCARVRGGRDRVRGEDGDPRRPARRGDGARTSGWPARSGRRWPKSAMRSEKR